MKDVANKERLTSLHNAPTRYVSQENQMTSIENVNYYSVLPVLQNTFIKYHKICISASPRLLQINTCTVQQ